MRRAQDGRKGMGLKGGAQANLLTSAPAEDPYFEPYTAIPGKYNGFEIEGFAVDDRRLLLNLRAARPLLAANGDPVRFQSALTQSVSLSHGSGTNCAEAICDLPLALSGGKARWLAR